MVFKSRRGGITTATFKALTCFCLSPPDCGEEIQAIPRNAVDGR